MKCTSCGNEMPDDALFCASCGSRLAPLPEVETPAPAAAEADLAPIAEPEPSVEPSAAAEMDLSDSLAAQSGAELPPAAEEPAEAVAEVIADEAEPADEPLEAVPVEAEAAPEPETAPVPEPVSIPEPEPEPVPIPVPEPEPVPVLVSEPEPVPIPEPQPVTTVFTPPPPVAPPSPFAQPQSAAAVCPQCQTPLKPGAKFCGKCGAKVEAAVTAAPPPPPRDSFCPRCAARVKPGAAFCPSCGTRLQGAAPQPVVPPVAPYPQRQQPAPYPPQQTPAYAAYPNPYQPVPAKPKKKRGLLVAIIVILVLAVAGFGVFQLFGRDIKHAIMGPKGSYLSIEGLALKDNASDLVEDLVKYGNKSSHEKGGYDLTIQLSADAEALELDPEAAQIFDKLRIKNSLVYDRTGDTSLIYDNVELFSIDEHLVNIEVLYDENELVIRVPELFDQYLVSSAGELADLFGSGDISFGDMDSSQLSMLTALLSGNSEIDLDIDQKALDRTFSQVIDIILKHIDTCELTKNQPLTAGSVTAKYDLYTMSISKESARLMFTEILELLRDDEEFFKLYSQLYTAFSNASYGEYTEGEEMPEMTFEQYQSDIQDAIDEIEAGSDSSPDFTINQLVYVNAQDEVVGRDLTVVDDADTTLMHFQYSQPTDGDQEAYLLSLDAESESFAFLADYTIKDGKKTGTATLSAMGAEVLAIDFADYVHEETAKDDKFYGRFDATITDSSSLGEGAPSEFSLELTKEGDSTAIDFSIPGMFGVQATYAEIAAGDVSIPSFEGGTRVALSDGEAMNQVMTAEVQDKVYAIFEKLGIDTSTME